jgi:hypothetical protein
MISPEFRSCRSSGVAEFERLAGGVQRLGGELDSQDQVQRFVLNSCNSFPNATSLLHLLEF